MIKNILAIAKEEKSVMTMGLIKATVPKTKVEGIMTDPIKSPRIIQVSPALAEEIEKYISGSELPNPTIRTPIRLISIPDCSAKNLAQETIPSEATPKRNIPPITLPKSFKRFFLLGLRP